MNIPEENRKIIIALIWIIIVMTIVLTIVGVIYGVKLIELISDVSPGLLITH